MHYIEVPTYLKIKIYGIFSGQKNDQKQGISLKSAWFMQKLIKIKIGLLYGSGIKAEHTKTKARLTLKKGKVISI